MKWLVASCLAALLPGWLGAAEVAPEPTSVSFRAIDVILDSQSAPLAAYQLHIRAANHSIKIVGIEGGDHPAFQAPPFYDPKAMQQERVILAAFTTRPAAELPRGRTRVATIHYQAPTGVAPRFTVTAQAAASADTRKIAITASLEERVQP